VLISPQTKRPDVFASGLFVLVIGDTYSLVRERQIGPQIVEVAWGIAIGRIIALPAEDGDIT